MLVPFKKICNSLISEESCNAKRGAFMITITVAKDVSLRYRHGRETLGIRGKSCYDRVLTFCVCTSTQLTSCYSLHEPIFASLMIDRHVL